MGIINCESRLLLLWKLGKGLPQRSWWGENDNIWLMGKVFSFTSMELCQLSGIFYLKLNGKGIQRFLRHSMKPWLTDPKGLGASAVLQIVWQCLHETTKQHGDSCLNAWKWADIVLMYSEKPKDCLYIPIAEAPHNNTSPLSMGSCNSMLCPFHGQHKGYDLLILQSSRALRFNGSIWNLALASFLCSSPQCG